MVIGLFGSITRGPCGRLGISFVNWVDKIDGRSRGSREVAVWDVEVIFRSGSDSGLVDAQCARARGEGRSGSYQCRSILTNLTNPAGRKSIKCEKAALKRSGRCGGRGRSPEIAGDYGGPKTVRPRTRVRPN